MDGRHSVFLVFGLLGCSSKTKPQDASATNEEKTEKYTSMRSELPTNMNGIRTMQQAYMQEYDVYVPCSPYPEKPSQQPQTWENSASGSFQTIQFSPKEDVRGSYMVSTTGTGFDFTVIGISDVDGDGVYATYMATKSIPPTLQTAPDIY